MTCGSRYFIGCLTILSLLLLFTLMCPLTHKTTSTIKLNKICTLLLSLKMINDDKRKFCPQIHTVCRWTQTMKRTVWKTMIKHLEPLTASFKTPQPFSIFSSEPSWMIAWPFVQTHCESISIKLFIRNSFVTNDVRCVCESLMFFFIIIPHLDAVLVLLRFTSNLSVCVFFDGNQHTQNSRTTTKTFDFNRNVIRSNKIENSWNTNWTKGKT